MKTFQELTVSGEPEKLREFFEGAGANPGAWSRDKEAEERIARLGPPTLCFDTPDNSPLPPSGVFLMEQRDKRSVRVANIVPAAKHELSYDEYNSVLEAFCDDVVKPNASPLGLSIEVSRPSLDVGEYLSPSSLRLLRQFSLCANHSTGAAHPSDKERWLAFLVESTKEKTPLPGHVLRRWFLEEAGWTDVEIVDRLEHDYTLALEFHAAQSVA